MQYLHPIYAMLLLFGPKTLIQLRLHLLQKKSIRIIFFQSKNYHSGPLSKDSKILKSFDKTAQLKTAFFSKSFKGLLPPVFHNWFKFSFEYHSHDTIWAVLGYLKLPS